MDENDFAGVKRFVVDYVKKLGLSHEEALVCYTVLERGQLTILEVSRITGVERTKIYGIVERMVGQGILESTVDYKKKYIKACDFSKLELLLNSRIEQVRKLEDSFATFRDYVSEIQKQYNPTTVTFYRGKDGIKQILWNELGMREKKLYSFTYRHLGEIIGMKFSNKLSREYEIRGITIMDLQSPEFTKSITKKFHHGVFKVEARYIPKNVLNIPIALDIYDDIVAIFNWHKGEVFGVELHSDKFAYFMKQIFQIVWKKGSEKGTR